MKKILSVISLLSVFTLAAVGMSSCTVANTSSGANNKTINLFTWEGMFPQELLNSFENETGYKINYTNFDLDETMLTRLEAAKGGDYDFIIADDYIIETAIEKNLVKKLDASKLSNYSNINLVYQNQFFDPTAEYTVPYGAGVQTIVYNPEAVDIKITGYQDLWDESLKNTIGVVGNYRVVNGMALKVLGESYNVEDTAVLENAGALLKELAPNIRMIKDDNLQDDLISGEISAGIMYTSQVTLAMLQMPELEVVYPSEGIGFGIMAGFIPSNAPNPEGAYALIDFLLDGENAKSGFEHLGYYSTNKAADPLINDEYKAFLTLPEGFSGDMEMIQNISPEAEEVHTKIWTEFRNAASGR